LLTIIFNLFFVINIFKAHRHHFSQRHSEPSTAAWRCQWNDSGGQHDRQTHRPSAAVGKQSHRRAHRALIVLEKNKTKRIIQENLL
jgi:hypothetical protein